METLLIQTFNTWRCAILTLSRRRGEVFVIRIGEIEFEILIVDAVGKVKVGFDIPATVRVIRKELLEEEQAA